MASRTVFSCDACGIDAECRRITVDGAHMDVCSTCVSNKPLKEFLGRAAKTGRAVKVSRLAEELARPTSAAQPNEIRLDPWIRSATDTNRLQPAGDWTVHCSCHEVPCRCH